MKRLEAEMGDKVEVEIIIIRIDEMSLVGFAGAYDATAVVNHSAVGFIEGVIRILSLWFLMLGS